MAQISARSVIEEMLDRLKEPSTPLRSDFVREALQCKHLRLIGDYY